MLMKAETERSIKDIKGCDVAGLILALIFQKHLQNKEHHPQLYPIITINKTFVELWFTNLTFIT